MAQVHRVCLIGPECVGKTTFAERLARECNTSWIPEFAREYALRVQRELTADDVEPIAHGELALLDANPDARVLDTDLLSTVVYARYYYGTCPEWIEREARTRRADLYLLLDTDVAWLADLARDASADAREDLFDAFRAALDEFGTTWTIVSGGWEER
ncbi:MAG TPA: ATP-binding protein, partial [Thermoanaerobaculia bacterium]|nr:ATP-binding protein [Thermoanaerobaculia bacterium]